MAIHVGVPCQVFLGSILGFCRVPFFGGAICSQNGCPHKIHYIIIAPTSGHVSSTMQIISDLDHANNQGSLVLCNVAKKMVVLTLPWALSGPSRPLSAVYSLDIIYQ